MNDSKIKSSNVQYVVNGLKYLIEKIDIEEVRKIHADNTYKMSSGIIFIFITSLTSVVEGILKNYLSGEIEGISDSDDVEGANYKELKEIFKKLRGESFNEKLKFTCESNEKQKDICEDIDMLFQFRNFITHSNSSEIKFTGDKSTINELSYSDYEFIGKTKKLHDYLTKKELIKTNKDSWFIDQLTNKEILDFFFNLVFKDFLRLAIWNTSSNVTCIKASIKNT